MGTDNGSTGGSHIASSLTAPCDGPCAMGACSGVQGSTIASSGEWCELLVVVLCPIGVA